MTMTIADFRAAEGLTIARLAAALTEEIKSNNREDDPIYQNRLNRLMAGAQPRPHELRALLAISGYMVDSFRV